MSQATKKTAIDYNTWSKEDLIVKIKKLECHVQQLRNVISKADSSTRKRPKLDDDDDDVSEESSSRPSKKEKTFRKFDFSS